MDIITIILIVVTCGILGLGFAVVHTSHERLNRLYFTNIVAIIGWSLTMMFYRLSSDATILLSAKLLYVAASLIASNFLYFTFVFPKYINVSWKSKVWIFFPNLILILIILIGSGIITAAKVNPGGENFIYWGYLYPLYVVYILVYFNLAFYRLFIKYRRSSDRVERTQLRYVLLGYSSSGFISFTTNLILPSFGYFTLNWVGQVSTILMAISAAYAIVKHHLFNARVIAAELLVFVLWIILLIRTLTADQISDKIGNGITLFITFFAGLLLIRSVIREVNQREKIELLAQDLQKANDRLTELDRQKSEFVSFATHQLRAPLTAMKGYGSLLLEGDMGTLPPEAKEGIQRIFDSANTLVSIVDDYLNITRIELGTMKYAFDTIDLKQLVSDVIAELEPTISKMPILFTFTTDDVSKVTDWRITADKDKLKQVIVNLIDNSLKYTPSGKVEVSLNLDKSTHRFVFKLKDTGIGIDPEILPRLFQKFSRAGNANKTNIKGTGLGLFVAKQMVEAHHGTIRAESAGEGKGSTFIVELEPFKKA